MLRGQAKKDYQKKYMERKRSNTDGSNKATGLTVGSNIEVDAKTAAKLLMICGALDKDVLAMNYTTGEFKKSSMLNMVNYGINGPTMAQVKERLE